ARRATRVLPAPPAVHRRCRRWIRRGPRLRSSRLAVLRAERRPTTEESSCDALQAGVGAIGADPNLPGNLLSEADALPSDGIGHRRAVRDLVHEHPELLALEQSLDDRVE